MRKLTAAVDDFKRAQDSLVIQASDLSLETIASMVEDGAIDVAPKYQRRERWSIDKQRMLIESFLLNVPVPPIYLFEEDYGIYSVIDGKQRIIAISDFMRNQIELKNLYSFTSLDGCRFTEMPAEIRNAFKVRPYLRVVTLLKQSDNDLKYEVFRRLNEGGEPLNAQEIRNVIFRGSLNNALIEMSENKFLLEQMKVRTRREPTYRQMANVEVVLRFFVLIYSWKSFSGSFRRSLDDFMLRHMDATPAEISNMCRKFHRSIMACSDLFGRHAFKRPTVDGWRDQFLIGMYDAQMIATAEMSDDQIFMAQLRANELPDEIRALVKRDESFENSVREATNTPARIKDRIRKVLKVLT
jgi:uncharacterized protein DUF262